MPAVRLNAQGPAQIRDLPKMQQNPKPIATPASREFEYSSTDFEQVRKLIYERAGISLSPMKHDMVYGRLARRLRTHGLKRFADYLALLEADQGMEWEAFINALTTNLTAFFREQHHFQVLVEYLAAHRAQRDIVLWSCASSTGEEPYSMAITVAEFFGSMNTGVKILATDLDTGVLRQAETGIYSQDKLEKISPELRTRYFVSEPGLPPDSLRVRPELRHMVSFRQINLLDKNWPIRGPIDAIFCRNVLIYFDKKTQADIVARFAPLLREDGLLFIGHSENLLHISDIFRLRGKTVYEHAHARGRK